MKKWAYQLLDVLTSLAAVFVRLFQALAKGTGRFVRLASLRACARGRIPVTTQFDGPVRVAGTPHLLLGEHCRLGKDVFFETNGEGRIVLGSRVRVNMGTVLVSHTEIRLGDDVLIGEYVSIRDGNHATEPGTLIRLQDHVSAPIIVGNDVWICRGSVILKGVSIGDGAVIGANSVVTKDIPANAVAAGAPARVVRYRDGSKP